MRRRSSAFSTLTMVSHVVVSDRRNVGHAVEEVRSEPGSGGSIADVVLIPAEGSEVQAVGVWSGESRERSMRVRTFLKTVRPYM